ncbi:MAG: (2Fe-2S)-binding protein [Anaerolineae bacterium]|nr:(2Fe-2S)-binding protein [Thermoflexales bacterium]MDW8395973.1 (2Fe-2S)-binding protein [Anaerolineae bacterium]
MELLVNGQRRQVSDESVLVWALRDELGLTGTKIGCGIGLCGACTVIVDGQAVRSCITPVRAVSGKSILTIEGLAKGGTLHPVQQAFIDYQVPQCGWCMSGQIMSAVALLEQNPRASEREVLAAMSRNLCRCGCYVRIRAAVLDAQRKILARKEGNA